MKIQRLTFLLIVLMSMVGVKTYATFIVTNDDGIAISYGEIDRNTVEIYNCHAIGNVVIPETVNYAGNTYTVTGIHYNAFTGDEPCTVSLPKTITTIGYYAFFYCKGLTSITMPGVESIGSGAFENCSKLASITIPSSVTSIGSAPFANCSNLTTVIIESNTITSENRNNNFSLGNIFGQQVTEYFLGDEITEIGEYAFYGCSALSSISLSNNIKEIKKCTFQGCKELKTIDIPNNVGEIGDYAFYGCSSLESIKFSKNLTKIGGSAFSGCGELSSIEIPNGTATIGTDAFEGCVRLKKVITRDLDAWCKIVFSNAKANPLSAAHHLYQSEDTEITELTIPESIDNIGKYSFYNATNLNSCVIPNNIKEVSVSAFEGCTNLVTLSLADGIAIISDKAFNGCEKIQILEIPNSVTSIGASAFGGSRINSLYVGTGVSSIGTRAFGSIKPTKTIWFTNTPPNGYTYAEGEVNYVMNEQYKSLSNQTVYPYLNSYFITDGVKYVPVNPSERTCDIIDGCYDNTAENILISPEVQFKNVSMSVKTLAQYAFYNNQSIKKVNMEFDGYIGNRAFSECANLQEVNIEISGMIDTYAFSNCTGLKDVTISKSKKISYNSFFQSGIQGVLKITNTGEIGSSAFSEIVGEFKAIIANDMKIETNAFSNCKGLQEVVLGDEITELEDKVFYGCTGLDSITIGAQIKKIGKEAFYDCKKISKIISRATTPPVCNTYALDNINKWNCQLCVPKGSLSSYQAADQWKDFFFISEVNYGGNTPDNPDNKKCEKPTISYNKGELSFASDTEGVEFVSEISDNDIATYTTSAIQLGVTYNISVYATKSGYENSETVTATLCWIDIDPKTEGITNSVSNVRANAVLIQSDSNILNISGVPEGSEINVYNLSGQKVGSTRATCDVTNINTTLKSGEIGIVKIGQKSLKVIVK